MFDFDYFEEIWATLTRNKWRSFMTAMGVFWAIFMLVIMSGAGFGIEQMIFGNISLATKSCMFFSQATSEEYNGLAKGRTWYAKFDDVGNFRESIEGVKHISRRLYTPYMKDLKAVNGMRSINVELEGYEPESIDIERLDILFGRYINDIDMINNRMVCSIGVDIYRNLFPDGGDPTGGIINIGRNIFTIIGVHKEQASQVSVSVRGNVVTMVIAPLTTIQKIYNTSDNLSRFMVSVKDNYEVSEVESEIIKALKQLYNISPNDKKAVMSYNIDKQFKIFENLFTGINVLIWIVGIGTLLAGVVGVSNIMLIVVKERTQEIGIRRALGATPFNIISQIMSESFILIFITGVAALGVSVGCLSLIDGTVIGSSGVAIYPQITFNMAISFALIIIISGLVAGAIPAIRAVNIKAVDAIRED